MARRLRAFDPGGTRTLIRDLPRQCRAYFASFAFVPLAMYTSPPI